MDLMSLHQPRIEVPEGTISSGDRVDLMGQLPEVSPAALVLPEPATPLTAVNPVEIASAPTPPAKTPLTKTPPDKVANKVKK